jgi:cold shock CspA family protein
MGKSQQTFGKKEREKKKLRKREEKARRKQERAENSLKGEGLDAMIMSVDEYGRPITDGSLPQHTQPQISADEIVLGIPMKEESDEPVRHQGRLAFANMEKGYGFIADNDGKNKYFVHFSNVVGPEIQENDKVEYDLEKGPRGMNAIAVKKI